MSDKKFTDEELISSLEVIATTCNCNECKIRNCKMMVIGITVYQFNVMTVTGKFAQIAVNERLLQKR